ncbi:MAG: hypothetical protein H0V29_00675 [Thermoleophilaceae bacterium]|nr:hypothetical protein [Thermoleophilaceae bacterium]
MPQGFYGTVFDGDELRAASPATQEAIFKQMAESGVESLRVGFYWSEAQPEAGGPISFAFTDQIVAGARKHGLDVVPVVIYAPPWARVDPKVGSTPPTDNTQYAAYLRALIQRYGNAGTFWNERPDVPRKPIGHWQIWNEAHLRYQWTADNWEQGYGKLLKVAADTVHTTDRRAKVVLAGFTNFSWKEIDSLYAKGDAKGNFDIVALHPFTASPRGVVEVIKRVRAVMRKRGDAKVPIWVSELTWPATDGRIKVPASLRTVGTNDRGMASRLSRSYDLLAKERRKLGVERVHWYTWASDYKEFTFHFSGLFRYDPMTLKLTSTPGYRAYVKSARKHQGCRKNSLGACR